MVQRAIRTGSRILFAIVGAIGGLAVWPIVAGDGMIAYERGAYTVAFRMWRAGAERGNAAAAFDLGLLYQTGRGVRQDYTEAARWFSQAAEQGFAPAQVNLGAMYAAGAGVEQDYGKAVDWFRRAASRGNDYADFNLGFLSQQGRIPAAREETRRPFVLVTAENIAFDPGQERALAPEAHASSTTAQ